MVQGEAAEAVPESDRDEDEDTVLRMSQQGAPTPSPALSPKGKERVPDDVATASSHASIRSSTNSVELQQLPPPQQPQPQPQLSAEEIAAQKKIERTLSLTKSDNYLAPAGLYYDTEVSVVTDLFKTDLKKGLTNAEVTARTEKYGFNKYVRMVMFVFSTLCHLLIA